MKRPAAFAVAAGILLLAACGGGGAAEESSGGTPAGEAAAENPRFPAPGSEIPDYAGVSLEGDTVLMRDYRGEVLLLNVWATWCPACRREMPSLQTLHEELRGEGLRLVGVSIDAGQGSERAVRDFLEEYGITYTNLHDPAGRIQATYRVVGIPTTYLVDREGRVAMRWIGEVDFGAPEIRAEIRRVLVSGERGPRPAKAGG